MRFAASVALLLFSAACATGCERRVFIEYEFDSSVRDHADKFVQEEGWDDPWTLTGEGHKILMSQRSENGAFRIFVVTADTLSGPSPDGANPFLEMNIRLNTTCPAAIDFYNEVGNAMFLYQRGDNYDLAPSPPTVDPPAQAAIIHVIPCEEETGTIEIQVLAQDGIRILSYTAHPRLVQTGWDYNLLF